MNEKLEHMKEEYRQRKASPTLRANIQKMIEETGKKEKKTVENEKKSEKKEKFLQKKRKFGVAAACVAVCAVGFVGSLNVSPAFAASMAELPGMESVVKVLTFHKYEFSEDTLQAEVVTPEITGLADEKVEQALNTSLQEYADQIIAQFEKDVADMKEAFPDGTPHLGVTSDYIVKTDTPEYLAIDVYVVNTVGSSSTVHKFYTINKITKSIVTLPSLFQEGADYVTPISEYIVGEMKRQMAAGETVYWVDDPEIGDENFTEIKKDQNFYINDKGNIVICFDKYEVAPGSSGSPEFEIPQDVVADILK